jgi:hypothetical protein
MRPVDYAAPYCSVSTRNTVAPILRCNACDTSGIGHVVCACVCMFAFGQVNSVCIYPQSIYPAISMTRYNHCFYAPLPGWPEVEDMASRLRSLT